MWKQLGASLLILLSCVFHPSYGKPIAHDTNLDVTYKGVTLDGIETFFSIPYGEDTGGSNRFKNPIPYTPKKGSTFHAVSRGPACAQQRGNPYFPLYLGNVSYVSENCLNVNVYRAAGTAANAKLPVLVYIHGGGFWIGSKDEPLIQPGGLILRSVEMGIPVMQVNVNYRLGSFGFAQSAALSAEGNTNFGVRDQRLAIEWVRDNIEYFGGDPNKIQILGQSSGGLAMGIQMLAYGGSRGFPFQQVSAESQILEGGITGNFTANAMERLVNGAGCNTSDVQSAATLACLRGLSMEKLLTASVQTHHDGPGANVGDEWLPMVDGDFLPAAPTTLIAEGKFAKVTVLSGWCENDGTFFVGNPTTDADVFDFFSAYLPGMPTSNVKKLLSLYPVSDFSADKGAKLSAQVFRAGRILRDILFTCQPLHFGQALQKAGQDVYYWVQNKTMLNEVLVYLDEPGYGVIHTSNFAYEFHNLSFYNTDEFPYHPNKSDHVLAKQQSSTWAAFANFGRPSMSGGDTLQGWTTAFKNPHDLDVFVLGGPYEGLSAEYGSQSTSVVAAQKLKERCGFMNSPEVIKQFDY